MQFIITIKLNIYHTGIKCIALNCLDTKPSYKCILHVLLLHDTIATTTICIAIILY